MLTIFTPTYNRAYILSRLYESLCSQTCLDFEWLVVDDGSTDNTEQLFSGWISESKINIRYQKVENGGKASAINIGVRNASGDIFFIVDSDDKLSSNAVQRVLEEFGKIENQPDFAGVCFRRGKMDGSMLGPSVAGKFEKATALEYSFKYGLPCDKSEVFFTSVLMKYPFPKIEGCKFHTEALCWNRMARDGLYLAYVEEVIYLCEYLPDGYTKGNSSLLRRYPEGFYTYYKELFFTKNLPFMTYVKSGIRCIQCRINMIKNRNHKKQES